MNEQQMTLVPEKRPRFIDERVPLDELPPDEELVGPGPAPELVESIRRWGIQESVVLYPVEGTNDQVKVASGRRRIKAARIVGLTEVPARILITGEKETGWMPDVMTLAAHATRRTNPVADLEAIESLVHEGADEAAIREATGMTLQVIRKRMRLMGLHTRLRAALNDGHIAVSVGERAAKLDKVYQDRLVEIMNQKGKITGPDVDEVRRVGREAAQKNLVDDLDLEAMPGTDDLYPGQGADPEPGPQPGETYHPDNPASMPEAARKLHKACVSVIDGVREGDDIDSLITRILDLETAFKQASLEGVL